MKMLSFPELKTAKGIPYSRVHLRRLEAAGRFPRRAQLGGNAVAWIESEIDAWLEERAAERDYAAKRVAAEAKDQEADEASAAEDGDDDDEEDEVA